MFCKFQVQVSGRGNIASILPRTNNGDQDYFVVVDAVDSSVAMSCEVAMAGLLACAASRDLSLRDYMGSLAELNKEDQEPKPEEKKEEPNVTSIQE